MSSGQLKREDVKIEDTWDLSSLYTDHQRWEEDFATFAELIEGYAQFQGKLAESPAAMAAMFEFDLKVDRLAERIGTYAFLKTTEDQADSERQALVARFQSVAVKAGQLASYIRPEIMAMDEGKLAEFEAAPELADFSLVLKRISRYRNHTLSDNEERLLAMQGEMAQTANKVFHGLNDADMKFGEIADADGNVQPLTNASYGEFMISPSREVRKSAFEQYYQQFEAHENTLAATLAGSIHGDVYYAKARNYASSLDSALYPDDVPAAVYDNLTSTIRGHLPAVHQYLDYRRRAMQLEELHQYDTYVPILSDVKHEMQWDEAVQTLVESLAPMGSEYQETLAAGLRGRWCDRYPNEGKQSGAFSCGSFDGDPYILMNYKPTVLNDLFTLTHEAGHSMHSHYSASNQPFQYYNYTIFVAEVASTFNEQLLTHHLLNTSDDPRFKAYLLNHEIDSIRATIVRQTMFAEFERTTHEMAEAGEPLTVDSFKSVYRELLQAYFGPDFIIDEQLALECFRIPHFYRAFYVYKYATGLSAAIALSRRVLDGGQAELTDYFSFLKGGCSKDPLDLLRAAGVDMASPEPIETAMKHFSSLVAQLDELTSALK